MAVVTAHNQLVEVEPEQTVTTCRCVRERKGTSLSRCGREEGVVIKHNSLGTIEHLVKSALY